MAVTDWPTYLLRGIPPALRAALTVRAAALDVSLADVVRQALCRHYGIDCPPQSDGYQPQRDTGGDVIYLRLQPEVWRLMRKQTRGRYGQTRAVILAALEQHLEEPQ